MAYVEFRPRRTRVIAYVDKQKTAFVLGQVTKKQANEFGNNIEDLLHSHRNAVSMTLQTSEWLSKLADPLYQILVDAELVPPRSQPMTLGAFIDKYIDGRTDVTPRRVQKLREARKRILRFFGDVDVRSVKPGDADEFSRWLLLQNAHNGIEDVDTNKKGKRLPKPLSPATAQKQAQIAAQFFRHAYRKGIIHRNPFEGVTVGTAVNDDRKLFISRDTIAKVIDACPDWQWRLVVALARYGGLRIPSEMSLLRWTDIHWDQERFTVTSPKTERYGKGMRIVPLFPELRQYLDEAWDLAPKNAEWVLPRWGGTISKNLGTTFRKIIKRAAVDSWPKPFHNLRASRQTELEQTFPTYVVCKWMGNTPNVANRHYLTVTDEHYESAVKTESQNWGQTGDKLGTRPPESTRTDAHEKTRIPTILRENASFSDIVALLEICPIAEEGLEPPTRGL